MARQGDVLDVPGAQEVISDGDRGALPRPGGGELELRLSRWLWLVKWLLAIPHVVVLVLLWLAYGVLTVVAFFAILFTGRYPARSSSSTSGYCAGRGG
jgi:hypothetical protein